MLCQYMLWTPISKQNYEKNLSNMFNIKLAWVFRCQRYAVLVLQSVAIALKISGLCLAKKIFECCCISCSNFTTGFEKDKSQSHVRKADWMTKLCSAQHILNNGTFTDPYEFSTI